MPDKTGRSLKILSVIDEFTRECIALEVHRRFRGEDVAFLMRDLFVIHGVPEYIRSDNGPEFISQSLRSFLDVIDVGTSYIEPGSPWQNGFVESFHSRFRDECLACELFWSLAEARQVITQWKEFTITGDPIALSVARHTAISRGSFLLLPRALQKQKTAAHLRWALTNRGSHNTGPEIGGTP